MQFPLKITNPKNLNQQRINAITSSTQFVCNALDGVKSSKYSGNKLISNKLELKIAIICSASLIQSKLEHQIGNLSLVPDQVVDKAKYELVVDVDDKQKEALIQIYQACFDVMKPGETPSIQLPVSNTVSAFIHCNNYKVKFVYPVVIEKEFSVIPIFDSILKDATVIDSSRLIETLSGSVISVSFTAVPWSINGKSGVSFRVSRITKLGEGSFGCQRSQRHSAEDFTPMEQAPSKKAKII